MELPVLYKYTSKGQVQQWQIFWEGDKFWTVEGIKDGKLTTSLPTICKPKNIGKKNETSAQEQAELEARAKWRKKKNNHYNEVLTGVRSFFEPMLAQDAKESSLLNFRQRTFVQPKLDGLRCISSSEGLFSRNGKPYSSCPHVQQTSTILDGELYSHTYHDNFNEIVSLCKKQKPTDEELQKCKEHIKHWVYDFPEHEGPFSQRYAMLKMWLKENNDPEGIFLVPTFEVKNMDEVNKYHEQFLSEGYEGTIIRIDIGPYENKRSAQLLKYKDFKDEEFEIIDVVEGEGGRTNTIGKFMLKTKDGKTFGSNVKGNFSYLRSIIETHRANPNHYIGKTATVKYFSLTPDGIPRFPFVIKIGREEYE